jgi:hypothetical protein
MTNNEIGRADSTAAPGSDRRGPDRRKAQRAFEGADRRKSERRSGTDRRAAPR